VVRRIRLLVQVISVLLVVSVPVGVLVAGGQVLHWVFTNADAMGQRYVTLSEHKARDAREDALALGESAKVAGYTVTVGRAVVEAGPLPGPDYGDGPSLNYPTGRFVRVTVTVARPDINDGPAGMTYPEGEVELRFVGTDARSYVEVGSCEAGSNLNTAAHVATFTACFDVEAAAVAGGVVGVRSELNPFRPGFKYFHV
jgi:hypothetical protein